MKKTYYCLFALVLMTHSTYSGFPAFKSQESSGLTWLIAAGGLVVGAFGTWLLTPRALSQAEIKALIAAEVAIAKQGLETSTNQKIKTLEDTQIKTLTEGQTTLTNRLDHLEDTSNKHAASLKRYKAHLASLTRPPETDPIRAAYMVRSNSMPHLTPRSDANDDEDDAPGDFDNTLARAYESRSTEQRYFEDDYPADDEEEEQDLSASVPVQRTQSNVSLVPRLSSSAASSVNNSDDEADVSVYFGGKFIESPRETPESTQRSGGLSKEDFTLQFAPQSRSFISTPLSPRGVPDEQGKTVYNDGNALAGRRHKNE